MTGDLRFDFSADPKWGVHVVPNDDGTFSLEMFDSGARDFRPRQWKLSRAQLVDVGLVAFLALGAPVEQVPAAEEVPE